MKTKQLPSLVTALFFASLTGLHAAELHVAVTGSDTNPGTKAAPFKTIQHAADLAQPGDTVTVHAGVYRERIDPPRGGESDAKRITYQAAPGEKVVIKGSEVVKGWTKVSDDLWKVTLPKSFFGNFNPYEDIIHGDYIFTNRPGKPNCPKQHTGMVYLDGIPLEEAEAKDEHLDKPYWFAEVTGESTTLWAVFKGVDPNQANVEINVRQSVFYPSKEHINYITVRGFEMTQAAANWAPPTAEQIGLLGTHWSKGWIIENNTISHSRCVGITLGKFGDKYDNTYGMDSPGWTKGVEEALAYGWTKDEVGHHRVSHNTITFCGQAGIVGSLGCSFSTIDGNTIHDIALEQRFGGYETAGIKLHGAVDVVIYDNHIYRCEKGIWLDWMAQGTMVYGNLFHDNYVNNDDISADLFFEVSHGPTLVYNNILLSERSLRDLSNGGAYCHNLFAGRKMTMESEKRRTPYFKPHSLDGYWIKSISNEDKRFYNNILVGTSLSGYKDRNLIWLGGNVFVKGGTPCSMETKPLLLPDYDPKLNLVEKPDGWYLELAVDKSWGSTKRPVVTTDLLGKALTPNQAFEHPNGTPVRITTDYFDKPRDSSNPFPGPFEITQDGTQSIKVWPK